MNRINLVTCYRIQPIGLEIKKHHSETSNGNQDRGVHVFGSLSELCGGVAGWMCQDWAPEIVQIQCESRSLADNGDYEGYVLVNNRGSIVNRKAFDSWDALLDWAKGYLKAHSS